MGDYALTIFLNNFIKTLIKTHKINRTLGNTSLGVSTLYFYTKLC